MDWKDYLEYRAALISIGFLYDDYDGPLLPEWIESAKRIIAEREPKGSNYDPKAAAEEMERSFKIPRAFLTANEQ